MDSEDEKGMRERVNLLTSIAEMSNCLNSLNNNLYFVEQLHFNLFVGIYHSEWISKYIHEEKKVSNDCPNIFALEKSTNIYGYEYIGQKYAIYIWISKYSLHTVTA